MEECLEEVIGEAGSLFVLALAAVLMLAEALASFRYSQDAFRDDLFKERRGPPTGV